mgnify:CR=1 FL=1
MKLSILIPVFNEEKTVGKVIEKVSNVVIPGIEREIIIIDDGSTDASVSIISTYQSLNFKFIKHKKNMGKGAAVRTGLQKATGEYVVIQDADLEYDPRQIKKLIKPILEKKTKVVYGTRLKRLPNFSRDEKTPLFLLHYLGNKFLSLATSMLYFQWLTDMETCYKVFPRNAFTTIPLHARGFELEPEITAKLLKKGYSIIEVPIATTPRGYADGKKIHAVRDGTRALWALIKYRFTD